MPRTRLKGSADLPRLGDRNRVAQPLYYKLSAALKTVILTLLDHILHHSAAH